MENFMLWSVAPGARPLTLSFFATRIQWPCIGRGTREMIDRMLADLGISGVAYSGWSVRHFRSHFHASADEPPTAPEAWADAWELSLELAQPAPPDVTRVNEKPEIARTFARDETWDGSDPLPAAPYDLVGRFYNDDLFDRARVAFQEVGETGSPTDPELADLIEDLRAHPLSPGISTHRRLTGALDLVVSLGAFDEASFSAEGSDLAQRVSELIHEFGGTTTWDEGAALLLQQRP